MKKKLLATVIVLTLLSSCADISNAPETKMQTIIQDSPIEYIKEEVQPHTSPYNPIEYFQEELKPEYIKLTSQEAKAKMSNEVIILDVRTQEEFDEGHIKNAILLPDYQIETQIENAIIDKNQTILVYCRTGRRSEIASKKMIGMGYTKVFDFGGIEDWTGEIVREGSDNIYYNYLGGELPEDTIMPFVYSTTKSINNEIPLTHFTLEGEILEGYVLLYDTSKYYATHKSTAITKLTISCENESFHQEFTGLQTDTWATEKNMYGLSFEDWNFDGHLDIALWRYLGGTSLNSPHYYWLWDNTTGEFIANTELEEVSDYSSISIDYATEQIRGYSRFGSGGYGIQYYNYQNGSYVMVKSENAVFEQIPYEEDKYGMHIIVMELVDGEMVVTEDYFEDL